MTMTGAERQKRYVLRKNGLLPLVRRMTPLERNRKYKYGVSPLDFESMFNFQDGKCAICSCSFPIDSKQWCVDHNHDTGAVRGLLCKKCNVSLGHIEKNINNLDLFLRHIDKEVSFSNFPESLDI